MERGGVADVVFEIEQLLRTVAGTVRRRGRAILTDFEITTPQFDSLVIISNANKNQRQLTIGDLSSKMGLAYSTTTDLVDRLERRRFVERLRDPDDKRVVRLRILDHGREIIEQVLQVRRAYLGRVLDRVGTGERLAILESLRHLSRHLSEVD